MSATTLEYYIERADQCRREADGTDLANVRERCLRAAEAWDAMADRVRRTDAYREGRIRQEGTSSGPLA